MEKCQISQYSPNLAEESQWRYQCHWYPPRKVTEKTIVEPTQTQIAIKNQGKKSAHFEKESWGNFIGLPAENEWVIKKENIYRWEEESWTRNAGKKVEYGEDWWSCSEEIELACERIIREWIGSIEEIECCSRYNLYWLDPASSQNY